MTGSETASFVSFTINPPLPTNLSSFFYLRIFLSATSAWKALPAPSGLAQYSTVSSASSLIPQLGLGPLRSLSQCSKHPGRGIFLREGSLSRNTHRRSLAGRRLHPVCKGVLSPGTETAGIPAYFRPDWRHFLSGTRGSAIAVPVGIIRRCTSIWLRW